MRTSTPPIPRPPIFRALTDELIVDSFAGGGGASEGIRLALGRGPDVAINHDAEAIALHAANHPETKHYQEDVWKVDPHEATAGRPVGLMWLSPDCKHFSKAKGGKPVSKKIRGLAWVAVRWAAAVRPRVIILENVEEFKTWGPVHDTHSTGCTGRHRRPVKDRQGARIKYVDRKKVGCKPGCQFGQPCKIRRGQTFRAFVRKLERLGYAVEWREMRACDFGAPTIRKRLFLIARCDGRPIVWPAPSHGKSRIPWRTAAECIDWSIECPSIFERKRELAENTKKRIARGIRRFVIETDRPFIVGVGGRQGQSPERGVDGPFQTITSKADSAVVVPHIVNMAHGGKEEDPALPLSTIATEKGGCRALIAPHITKFRSGAVGSAADQPMPTVTANSFIKRPGGAAPLGLAAATLVQTGYGEREGQAPRSLDLDLPLGTVVAGGQKHAAVAAFLAKHYSERKASEVMAAPMDGPAPTVTTVDHNALVTSHMLKLHGSAKDGRSMELPAPTVRAGGTHLAEVRAFLVAYYGNEKDGASLFDAMRTVTSKDRLGLVTIAGVEYVIDDIGMRMLVPRELYNAQGFGSDYLIDIEYEAQVWRRRKGKRVRVTVRKRMSQTGQVKMCGNSVSPPQARALVIANYLESRDEAVAA